MSFKLLLLFPLIAGVHCQFEVLPGPNATLTTYLGNETVVSTDPAEIFEKRFVNSSQPVSIFCTISMGASKEKVTVEWLKNNKALTVADKGRNDKIIGVVTETNKGTVKTTLTLKEPKETHATSYVCKFSIGSTTVNATIDVLSPPIISSFTKAKRAIQGDKLKITCSVEGHPLPESVTWFFGNRSNELVMQEGMTTGASENGVKDAILRFSRLRFEDRGVYWCKASNSLGDDTAGVLVRAKDRLDALWPFLGIVCEVFLLVGLILLYEKKRASATPAAEVNGVAGERPKEEDEEAAETAADAREGRAKTSMMGVPSSLGVQAMRASNGAKFSINAHSPRSIPIPNAMKAGGPLRMTASYTEDRPSPVGYWSDAQLMQKFRSDNRFSGNPQTPSVAEEKDEDVRQRPAKA